MRNISPSLNEKLKQQNQTHYNNANPKMNITIARARSSIIDSSYFNIEKIRIKEGIGDISIAARRLRPYGSPDRLYEIHIDNGIAKTAIREYPDEEREGWKSQFDIGEAKSVAIAFDGEWVLNDKLQWQIKTHEKPYIFWVNNGNVLKYRIWDEEGTTDELATEVAKAKAIRAWKNANIKTHDQGLLVAYIKTDGKVYYRNYCEQKDGTFIWETETQISEFTGVAVNLNLFITNDYRTGIIIEDSNGKIHWLITSRNWAGMAIAPEYIAASMSGNIDLIEIDKISTEPTREYINANMSGLVGIKYAKADNMFTEIYNMPITAIDENGEEYQDWGYEIIVKVQHLLTNETPSDFELIDELGIKYMINTIEKIDNYTYKINAVDFNNAQGNLVLRLNGSGDTKGEIGQDIDSFEIVFAPNNLVPTFRPVPEVEVIWNE